MQVIVLGGMARVGKTDIADWIVDQANISGMHPIRLSFADPLKKQAAESAGYGSDWRKYKEEKPSEYRKVCQDLGASKRAVDPDYWVNLWMSEVIKYSQAELTVSPEEGWGETVVVVDDCRYKNEVTAAKSFEAFTMFIYAGGRKIPDSEAAWRSHESEELSQRIEGGDEDGAQLFDWAVVNNGSTSDLEDKLETRKDFMLGLSPGRFSTRCLCGECTTFRFDIQNAELIESIKEALENLLTSDNLTEEQKEQIEEEFSDMLEDLEEGTVDVDGFFSKYWKGNLDDIHEEDSEDDDDEDDDKGDADDSASGW